jgi:hypothetical protein
LKELFDILARVRALISLVALLPGLARLASPEQMICLHRDGQVRVEPLVPACCLGEDVPICPDEECQDLPLVDPSPIDSPDAPIGLEGVSLPSMPPVEDLPPDVPGDHRPGSFSGPPPPGPERHLLTVVLRR